MDTRTGGVRHRAGERPAAERESAERQSAERQSAERQSAERDSAERQSAERDSAEREPSMLGSLTIPGRPDHVTQARAFITRALSRLPAVDSDAATLMTSELVTNAIQHTRSGAGGMVTVMVTELPGGALIEVTDDGSAGAPIVKSDVYTAEGHGLYLVQQLAAQWGYLRAAEGTTTVWFHVPAAGTLDTLSA